MSRKRLEHLITKFNISSKGGTSSRPTKFKNQMAIEAEGSGRMMLRVKETTLDLGAGTTHATSGSFIPPHCFPLALGFRILSDLSGGGIGLGANRTYGGHSRLHHTNSFDAVGISGIIADGGGADMTSMGSYWYTASFPNQWSPFDRGEHSATWPSASGHYGVFHPPSGFDSKVGSASGSASDAIFGLTGGAEIVVTTSQSGGGLGRVRLALHYMQFTAPTGGA